MSTFWSTNYSVHRNPHSGSDHFWEGHPPFPGLEMLTSGARWSLLSLFPQPHFTPLSVRALGEYSELGSGIHIRETQSNSFLGGGGTELTSKTREGKRTLDCKWSLRGEADPKDSVKKESFWGLWDSGFQNSQGAAPRVSSLSARMRPWQLWSLLSLLLLDSAGRCTVLESKKRFFSPRTKSRFFGVWQEREASVSSLFLARLASSALPLLSRTVQAPVLGKMGWMWAIHPRSHRTSMCCHCQILASKREISLRGWGGGSLYNVSPKV